MLFIFYNNRLNASSSCSESCKDLLALYNEFFPNFLNIDFFKNTNNITVRDVTSIPIIYVNSFLDKNKKDKISINFFYSGILSGVNFTKNSKSLNSVLNFGNFIKKNKPLFEFISKIDSLSIINFQLLENIADYFKIQQHRVGATIDGFFNFKNIDFFFQVPFIYQINNVYIEPSKKELIENEFDSISNGSKNDSSDKFTENFVKKNFTPDFIGFDRPLIGVQKNIIDNLDIEFFTKLPFGFQFKEGLIGGNFKNVHKETVDFKFSEEVNLMLKLLGESCADSELANNTFLDLLGASLRKISDAVFYIPFSEKPLSLGTGLTFNLELKNEVNLILNSRISYNFDFQKYRYGFSKSDEKFFSSLDYSTEDEIKACSILDQLDNEFIKRVLLVPFKAYINRPFEFQNSIFLVSNTDSFNFKIGTDLWYKSAEKLYFKNENLPDLNNIYYTESSSAIQNSFIIGLTKNKNLKNDKMVNFSLDCSLPIYSYGIGKELTASIKLEIIF